MGTPTHAEQYKGWASSGEGGGDEDDNNSNNDDNDLLNKDNTKLTQSVIPY